MGGSIVSAANAFSHAVGGRTCLLSIVETAAIVIVVVVIAAVVVCAVTYASVRSPPTRPIAPVPRRMPAVPSRTPKPVVDNRSIDIHRFDDVVFAVDILIAYHLYRDVICLIFLYIYTGNVLVDILCQNRLEHD